mgnify:CR=1 FL=1
MSDPLLEIKNLVTGFETESGLLKAVDGVSFTVPKGTCVGIVGESGCGKSVTAMSIVRLLPQPMGKILDGQILFKGRDLVQAKETDMHGIRGRHIGVIFQEPMTALNPVHSISRQIGESLMLHRGMNTREARDAAIQLLQRVRIPAPEQRVDEFPHQLSGGMRQRVVIALPWPAIRNSSLRMNLLRPWMSPFRLKSCPCSKTFRRKWGHPPSSLHMTWASSHRAVTP